ncbi:type IV pilin N-terminal domain-containing protein [Haloarcula sp. S1CR25-12]|uniref:Type IV pilin N-terminal domain-containing protein n=1 Tax=Haloarcula saliterrae TaxID=2950534 RepID=A0ABU2F935_9EURY|nr:type IV pilin N-terminal domain-containing protein [Haloarcula sp. S1CR25-12]MDS0258316.1 type IV pilin N-terminal domain-containing protein [Haloarcula sp. S1CR25-12]
MSLKNLFHDDDAVSPVIGVILMVAITVILAAVIASFVLGLGDQQQQTPQASFEWEYNSDDSTFTVTHDGGDSIDLARISIEGATVSTDFSDPVTAGSTAELDFSSVSSGDTVTVVWEDADEETSTTLATYEVP